MAGNSPEFGNADEQEKQPPLPGSTAEYVSEVKKPDTHKPAEVAAEVRADFELNLPKIEEGAHAKSGASESSEIPLERFEVLTRILTGSLGKSISVQDVKDAIHRIREHYQDTKDVELIARALAAQHYFTEAQAEILVHPDTYHFAGHYQILSPLGKGGMGGVFLVYDETANVVRAVKFPAEKADRARFIREAQSAVHVKHDNLVQVLQVEEEVILQGKRTPCYIMEFTRGEDLRERLQKMGRMGVVEACSIVAQAAYGLSAAHERNIAHRDVKPANILLTEKKERIRGREVITEEVKVTDFGLARMGGATDDYQTAALSQSSIVAAAQSHHTQLGTIMGTPAYMSPEQCLGQPDLLTEKSDVYSLGVVLYECLTGHPPYHGSSTSIMAQHKREAMTPPSITNAIPEVPRGLDAFIRKQMMAHDPAKRPPMRACLLELLRYRKQPTGKTWFDRWKTDLRTSRLLQSVRSLFSRKREKYEAAQVLPQVSNLPFDKWEEALLRNISQPELATNRGITIDTIARGLGLQQQEREELNDTAELPGYHAFKVSEQSGKRERSPFPYRAKQIIGFGGMGTVYEAMNIEGHSVALKVLRRHLLESVQHTDLFKHEAELGGIFASALVSMPVKVHETGQMQVEVRGKGLRGPMPYIVMDFVDGTNLKEICEQNHLSSLQAIIIAHLLAKGLAEEVHPRFVIHRDIKPENVMVERSGKVRLTDFGLSKLPHEESLSGMHEERERVVGTPWYMAPEIIQEGGSAADERSDVYSTACTLSYMLTGRSPYETGRKEEDRPAHAVHRILSIPLPSIITTMWEKIQQPHAAELERILQQALARRPEERYENAAAFAAALENLLKRMRLDAELPSTESRLNT